MTTTNNEKFNTLLERTREIGECITDYSSADGFDWGKFTEQQNQDTLMYVEGAQNIYIRLAEDANITLVAPNTAQMQTDEAKLQAHAKFFKEAGLVVANKFDLHNNIEYMRSKGLTLPALPEGTYDNVLERSIADTEVKELNQKICVKYLLKDALENDEIEGLLKEESFLNSLFYYSQIYTFDELDQAAKDAMQNPLYRKVFDHYCEKLKASDQLLAASLQQEYNNYLEDLKPGVLAEGILGAVSKEPKPAVILFFANLAKAAVNKDITALDTAINKLDAMDKNDRTKRAFGIAAVCLGFAAVVAAIALVFCSGPFLPIVLGVGLSLGGLVAAIRHVKEREFDAILNEISPKCLQAPERADDSLRAKLQEFRQTIDAGRPSEPEQGSEQQSDPMPKK